MQTRKCHADAIMPTSTGSTPKTICPPPLSVGGHNYTPGIYAEGYIVFAFPFVLSSVRMFIRSFVTLSRTWNLRQSFACKFLKLGISHEPLIRLHSHLDHRYPGGSAFVPCILTPGSIPRVGLEVKIKDTLKSVFLLFCYGKNFCR